MSRLVLVWLVLGCMGVLNGWNRCGSMSVGVVVLVVMVLMVDMVCFVDGG